MINKERGLLGVTTRSVYGLVDFYELRGVGGGGGVERRHLIICFHYCYGLDILFVLAGL